MSLLDGVACIFLSSHTEDGYLSGMVLLFVIVRKNSLSYEKGRVPPSIQGPRMNDTAKWRSLFRLVDQVREAFADVPADQLDGMIREAVESVRCKARELPPTV